MKSRTNIKGISPIISVILLIVVLTILIIMLLSYGKSFSNSELNKVNTIFKKSNQDYLVSGTKLLKDGVLTFKNVSPNNKVIPIMGYELLSEDKENSNFNTIINLDEELNIPSGGTAIISLIDVPNEKMFNIQLITSENEYILIENIINQQAITSDSNSDIEESALSSENLIISFTLESISGDINSDTNTITVSLPYGTSITSIAPTIVVSDLAEISPLSGAAQNFTNPVNYTVTAEDESTRVYVVTITVPLVPEGIDSIPQNGEIWYLEHLDYIDTNATTLAGTYILMRDLNFNDDSSYYNVANKTTWTTGDGWLPVGNSSTKFSGILNGNSKTISNLYINRSSTDYVGLFGYTTTNSQITSLNLEDVNVRGKNYVGGLIGYNYACRVYYSSITGHVYGTDRIGGLSGHIAGGEITNSYSSATISGSGYLGGLAGSAEGFSGAPSTITKSYSTGQVTGTGSFVGGLLGYSNAKFTIYNTYSTGTVIGDTSVGGLIGYFGGYNSAVYVYVFYSYATGHIRSSYTPYVGGLIGQKGGYSTITNCYWDMNTSGQTTSNGGIAVGKNTTEMKQQATFTDWNFSGIWAIDADSSYPYLSTNEQTPHPTPIDVPSPVLIYTADDLNNIRNNMTRTAYYSLANDIDLNISPYNEGSGWLPIGSDTNAFAGIFNANGHIIRNLYINRSATDYVGLFGYVNKYAQINDLNLVDVNIRGKTYVGAIAGMSYTGKILRSNATGAITATSHVGGLVGYQYSGSTTYSYSNCSVTSSSTGYIGGLIGYLDSGNVSYCYSTGAVTGGSFAGGAIGYSSGASSTVINNYSTSPVSGATYVGGFVGYINSGAISTNYSKGTVIGSSSVGGLVGNRYTGTAIYCYWDMNTSGITSSSQGTGKTTTEMKTQSTFTYWDFSTIWDMTEGTTYPYFSYNTQSPLPQ